MKGKLKGSFYFFLTKYGKVIHNKAKMWKSAYPPRPLMVTVICWMILGWNFKDQGCGRTWPRSPMGQHQPWDPPTPTLGLHTKLDGIQPCPPVGMQPLHKGGPGSQLGQGPASPTSTPIVVSPTTTEGPMQSTQGAPLECTALVTRGECAAEPHRTSPT